MNLFNKRFFSKKNSPKRMIIVAILTILMVSVGYVFTRIVTDKDGMFALVVSKILVNFTNEDRNLRNINSLTVNPLLEKAAQMKAQDMISKGYFAHQSPDGHSPWYWLDQVGYDFSYAGENLAVNFTESKDVNEAWLNSPKHKENIMNGNFTEIGIAVADGMYQGKMTTFVVQFFGKPAKKISNSKQTNTIKKVNIVTATSTSEKVSTTASSTVLGAFDQNILYTEIEKKDLNNSVKKSFWSYFVPAWF